MKGDRDVDFKWYGELADALDRHPVGGVAEDVFGEVGTPRRFRMVERMIIDGREYWQAFRSLTAGDLGLVIASRHKRASRGVRAEEDRKLIEM